MRVDASSHSEEEASSRRSSGLFSSQDLSSKPGLLSDHHSTTANSVTTTGKTKFSTVVSVSGSASSSVGSRAPPNPGNFSRLRKARSVPSKGFKTKADVPPIDFGKAGLVGRDEEIATLKSCYDRLIRDKKRELLLVGGKSGSGKSTLIRSMGKNVPVEGMFVEGKFDMNTCSEPYSGVAKAFSIICQKLKEAGSESITNLREDLRKELGDKPGLLVQLIPELQDIMIVGTATDRSVGSIDRVDETEGGIDRLRFAFRVLTRVFSSVFSPLIIGKLIAASLSSACLD